MERILLPSHYTHLKPEALIFLCGPLHGAPHWQEEAARLILRQSTDISVASPRRIFTDYLTAYSPAIRNYTFTRQRAWERYYLEKASMCGAILFWLPDPDPERKSADLTYGATTRFELGEWMTRTNLNPEIPLAIGGEEGFDTLRTIRYDMKRLVPHLTLHDNLPDLVDDAIGLARSRFKEYEYQPDRPEDIIDIVTIERRT